MIEMNLQFVAGPTPVPYPAHLAKALDPNHVSHCGRKPSHTYYKYPSGGPAVARALLGVQCCTLLGQLGQRGRGDGRSRSRPISRFRAFAFSRFRITWCQTLLLMLMPMLLMFIFVVPIRPITFGGRRGTLGEGHRVSDCFFYELDAL